MPSSKYMSTVFIRTVFHLALLLVLGLLLCDTLSYAEADPKQFVRVSRNEKNQPEALQTSIVTLSRSDGLNVDLVSAVHVGEAHYYRELNESFKNYEVVLYELIAPPDVVLPQKKKEKADNPLSMMQVALKNALQLEFQLDAIDYGAANFVHADMSPQQFFGSMERRNETFLSMFLKAFTVSLAKQQEKNAKPADLSSMFLLMFDDARAYALRRIMASELGDMDAFLSALNGPEGSTIISERNKTALSVLERQVSAGKKKIAIFYGGAHMPDMQQRLVKQFGLTVTGSRWVVAWKLAPG